MASTFFITNRAFNEGPYTVIDRKVSFDLENNTPQAGIFFCERKAKNKYTEIGSGAFMELLKTCKEPNIMLFIHGYSNLPEDGAFQKAIKLQKLFDKTQPGEVRVIPLIWPCDNDKGAIGDYFDDQHAADGSAVAFGRSFQKLIDWQAKNTEKNAPCFKRMHVLAHSMGNRVLRASINWWGKNLGFWKSSPFFSNMFLVAADIVNETLEKGQSGNYMCGFGSKISVFYASDDLALRISKAANLRNGIASRRLGHLGPEDMNKVPKNVFAFDCDGVNSKYDKKNGHTYFMDDGAGKVGKVFLQISNAVKNKNLLKGEFDRTSQIN